MLRRTLLLAAALLLPASAHAQYVRAVQVASGLTQPLFATAPDGDARLFVVERAGVVRIVENGAVLATPFLDIRSRVSVLGEGGLLGIAFPPLYAQASHFTVVYTDLAGDVVLSRFSVSANPYLADAASEVKLLVLDQPAGSTNHYGGTIAYGPDGFLWFASGDGGGSNDPEERAQDPQSLFGKMLRLDVGPIYAATSQFVPGEVYRIPADNPFVGAAPRDEIWALGLRNPYRWSFDRGTGDLWIGDVGQNAIEEVNFEPASDPGGRNYGWDVMEGTACNAVDPAPAPPCGDASLTLPVHEYGHGQGDCSIIGGYVHRADFSALNGRYFFGDFCTGRVWTLNPATGVVRNRTAELGAAAGVGFSLVGFGEDGAGGLLLVQRSPGRVYRIEAASAPPPGCGFGPELLLLLPLLGLAQRRMRVRRFASVPRSSAPSARPVARMPAPVSQSR